MPVTTPKYILQSYSTPDALPPFVWTFFEKNQQHTNVMYPVAKNLLESKGDPPVDAFWLTCSTNHRSATDPTLDFVLSVTPGPQGGYPVFICTPLPLDQLSSDSDYILPRMQQMVHVLSTSVPLSRVYSVFAPTPIANAFAKAWTRRTRIELDAQPEYYSAKLTYCTLNTFRNRASNIPLDRSYIMRPAVSADIPAAAKLCHGFAAVSEPFTLSLEGANEEATYLVQNNMLWVHEIIRPGQPVEVASIVATTRCSESVAGITKVFTDPDARNMGCAERLVRAVCNSLLKSHDAIVLYVAHTNPAASKVYHKVGFQGLETPKAVTDGVEDWLELGFDRKIVTLGHW